MAELEVNETGKGKVIVTTEVPLILERHLITGTSPLVMLGASIQSLSLEFKGAGFSVWYNRVWATERTILEGRMNRPVLELRIGLQRRINGKWKYVDVAEVAPDYFQLVFVPYVETKAVFEEAGEYQTFDIHFDVEFLERFGMDYRMMADFIDAVLVKKPVELAPRPYPCNREMVQLVNFLLSSDYSPAGRARQLNLHVEAILSAALETVSKQEGIELPLTKGDREALHEIKRLIAVHVPDYLSNDELLKRVLPHLNAFKLNYGFKRLFGMSPYEYYQRLRFELAKKLLRQGDNVQSVAFDIGYTEATTFSKEFRKRFGLSPKHWMRG